MTNQMFRVIAKRYDHAPEIGEIVYRCHVYDYGLSNDDTRAFGEDFTSVSRSADGGYPFVTVPVKDIEKI